MDRVISCFAYEDSVRDLICGFKFGERLDLVPYLAMEISNAISSPGRFDAIVPVPMHPIKVRVRGFNPAAMLANRVADALHLPMRRDLLRRVKYTSAQTDLKRSDRITNIRGVFTSNAHQCDFSRILLIDDVMTTGATANECARVLKGAGAREVWVVTVARRL